MYIIPGHGIFFMGVGRPNFGRGVNFFARGGQIFFAKKGGKGVGKIFFAKNVKNLPVLSDFNGFFLAVLTIF